MLTAGVARRSRRRRAAPATYLAVVISIVAAGCVAPIPPKPSDRASAAAVQTAAQSGTEPSAPATETESPSPSASVEPVDAGTVLRLCASEPPAPVEVPPSELACRDAIDLAVSESVLRAPLIRADMIWSPFCPTGTPCPSAAQDVDHAYVVLLLSDGTGIQVPIVQANGGLTAGAPTPLSETDIGPRPTFQSPPARKADVGPAPAVVTGRPALPFCGSEDAGLAGPFNTAGRTCFLNSLLSGQPAEFASKRSDVEGAPFFELWRFVGAGPVVIAHKDRQGWSRLVCGVNLMADPNMLIDHGDCEISPLG